MSIHIFVFFAKNKKKNMIYRKVCEVARVRQMHVRTDLALEARESVGAVNPELSGVKVTEEYREESDVKVTKVMIESKNASKKLGKPMGIYVTLETPTLTEPDEGYHREIAKEIARELQDIIRQIMERKVIGNKTERKVGNSVLVVGLGNRDVTADSLGPNVADHLYITKHMLTEFGPAAFEGKSVNKISCMVPGVMAKTGMETAEIIRGIVSMDAPDFIIAIDALAARSTKRLNRTIQITDTGIWPGTGVGNHRKALTKESLGVPVIALGIPTVVDAATIVNDALGEKTYECMDGMGELNNMYVTGKDIDEIIRRISYTVSEGINLALKLPDKD